MLLPPVIPEDVELVRFNPLLAHILAALSKSQSLSQLEVVPSQKHTVARLMELSFPGIKETNGERTPLVSKHTIGYIHALMIDTVTSVSSEPPKARALRNETMVVEELEANEGVWRSELRDCLVDYYVNILKMDAAGGMARTSTFKRKFKAAANATTDGEGAAADAVVAGGGGGGGGDAGDIALDTNRADATATPPPPAAPAGDAPAEDAAAEAAAAEATAAEAASPPRKAGGRRAAGGKGGKATA